MTIRRLSPLVGALALSVAVGSAAVPSANASASEDARDARVQKKFTKFAFGANGYGLRLRGGQLPAGSSTTSFMAIGCTNEVGIDRKNQVADVEIPGLGVASAVETRTRTFKADGATGVVSEDRIASITLGDSESGSVNINAVESESRVWHEGGTYHAETATRIGSIILTPPGGEPEELALPTPDQPIEIPGLVKIKIGRHKSKEASSLARAAADAIRISVPGSSTRLRVAHTRVEMAGGVKSGLFAGNSFALKGKGLEELAELGRQPLSIMPCRGTKGETRKKAIAGINVDDGSVVAEGLVSRQRGTNKKRVSSGFEEGKIAEVSLGDGQLVIKAIVGRANVTRERGKLRADIKGTEFGAIIANGERHSFPDSDVLEIPGVARLERNIVKRLRHGISVVALRVTLFDGSGAVVDLGNAKMLVQRSKR